MLDPHCRNIKINAHMFQSGKITKHPNTVVAVDAEISTLLSFRLWHQIKLTSSFSLPSLLDRSSSLMASSLFKRAAVGDSDDSKIKEYAQLFNK